MRRALLAVSTSLLLLAPTLASAAFEVPSDLFRSIHASESARSFQIAVHGSSNGTYVSVWGNGSEQGMDSFDTQLWMNATVDVAQNGMKVRLKGEVMIIGETLYLKVKSVDGSNKKAIDRLAAIAKAQQWIEIPMGRDLFTDVTGTDVGMLSSTDPAQADDMYVLQSAAGKNGTVYSLHLNTDFAPLLGQKLRMMLGDSQPISTDFLPWRELGEGMVFEMTVNTNAKDEFTHSSFSMSLNGTNSSFQASGTEKALAKSLDLTAPASVQTLDDVTGAFGTLTGELPKTITLPLSPSGMQATPSAQSMQHTSPSDCRNMDAMKLLMMQRTGVCATTKTTTRHGGW